MRGALRAPGALRAVSRRAQGSRDTRRLSGNQKRLHGRARARSKAKSANYPDASAASAPLAPSAIPRRARDDSVTVKYAETSMLSLDIPQTALDSIVAHARADAPRECCGLLVGTPGAVERAVATRNDAEAPLTRYRVHPADHFAVIRALRGSEQAVIGAYHSHPATDAAPSPTDTAEAWPAPFVYVIVSLKDEARPDVRAFGFADGKWVPVGLTTGRRP